MFTDCLYRDLPLIIFFKTQLIAISACFLLGVLCHSACLFFNVNTTCPKFSTAHLYFIVIHNFLLGLLSLISSFSSNCPEVNIVSFLFALESSYGILDCIRIIWNRLHSSSADQLLHHIATFFILWSIPFLNIPTLYLLRLCYSISFSGAVVGGIRLFSRSYKPQTSKVAFYKGDELYNTEESFDHVTNDNDDDAATIPSIFWLLMAGTLLIGRLVMPLIILMQLIFSSPYLGIELLRSRLLPFGPRLRLFEDSKTLLKSPEQLHRQIAGELFLYGSLGLIFLNAIYCYKCFSKWNYLNHSVLPMYSKNQSKGTNNAPELNFNCKGHRELVERVRRRAN